MMFVSMGSSLVLVVAGTLLAGSVVAQNATSGTTATSTSLGSVTSAASTVGSGTSVASTASATASAVSNSTLDCHCGFVDPSSGLYYTDSIITYFNETSSVPDDVFSIDSFAHPYEKGWDIFYREGATKENVYFTSGDVWNLSPGWLSMNVSGATAQHLVNGAQLSSVRKDIQYGTFRVFMRSPAPYAGGTALTMRLQQNETSSAELDLLNMDDSTDDACMQTSTSNQEPLTSWGVNYTALELSNVGPWDFWEWRMDWSEQQIDWYVAENMTRSMPTSNASLVDVPTSFYLKHWSNGDANFMQGPPTSASEAAIGWVRLFFNSSVSSTSDLGSSECDASQLCSTDDWTLRVSTSYGTESTVILTPKVTKHSRSRTVGIALCSASLAFGVALLLQAFIRKCIVSRRSRGTPVGSRRPKMPTSPWPSSMDLSKSRTVSHAWTTQTDFEMNDLKTPQPGASTLSLHDSLHPGFLSKQGRTQSERPLLGWYDSTAASSRTFAAPPGETPMQTPGFEWQDPFQTPKKGGDADGDAIGPYPRNESSLGLLASQPVTPAASSVGNFFGKVGAMTPGEASTADLLSKAGKSMAQAEPEGSAAAANPGAKPTPNPAGVPRARTRIDYLAGLVALMSLLVSCEHFILTYVPSVVENYLPTHYQSEYWARRTIEPFFFNEVLVGLFFTTSTRFLVSGFLRTGNLKTVAEKVVCRTPRLMIPITAVIMFEYFLMDAGAVTYLEYIPSISWSTWPSTAVFPNFGYFIDETLQMIYLIPNAAPNITWNYCTGVLWTIPVQLQFSWTVLLGAVVVRELKTPWKRFAYYAFCIINSWYALSWGSYFWSGLMLADLDITFKYRKYIHARPWVHYPLLTVAALAVWLSLANDLFSVWTGYTFSTEERGIHPEPESALPLKYTSSAGYPPYTEPKLNGLIFAVGSQYIVEISTWVQAVLSTRVFLWLFPHVFTIYLIHGLVWWTMGTLVCVYFAGQGLSYWLNILLTALICYATLFSILPIVTPVMEMLGKEITKGIWVSASEEPPVWRPTSYPFSIEEIRSMVYRKDDEDDDDGHGRVAHRS